MKKIFTLLFAVGIVGIASAQPRNAGRFNGTSSYTKKGNERHAGFVPYQMNKHASVFIQSKQSRKYQDDCYVPDNRSRNRFEKIHYQLMDKRFSRTHKNRW